MKWINSAGGPLIIIEKSLYPKWNGNIKSGKKKSDYDRACEVTEFIESIPFEKSSVLVLGDEPLITTWKACDKGQRGGAIIRCIYSPSTQELDRFVTNMDLKTGMDSVAPVVSYRCDENKIILWDSAFAANEKRAEKLEFELPVGQYSIESSIVEPDPEFKLIIHNFL